MNLLDLTGQKFGYWIVVCRSARTDNSYWICQCICKKRKALLGTNLKSGMTKSCGCKAKELLSVSNRHHGHAPITGLTSEYIAWCNLKARCNNPKRNDYERYGGRGIAVCERWMNSFENFIADMGLKPSPKLSIERIDNHGNYEPSNCKWATSLEQSRNQRPRRKKR